MSNNILITGVSGLLGSNLAYYFKRDYQVHGVYNNHPVDISGITSSAVNLIDFSSVKTLVDRVKPVFVIHCAARTDVDRIEDDKDSGWLANVKTAQVLLSALGDTDAKLIHISTDSVYSGQGGPYTENSPVEPCNWYGETKLESERLALNRAKSLILRTNFYGWNIQDKESLAEWFLNRLQKHQEINGFTDARFSSIYSLIFAEYLEKCIDKDLTGVFNFACRDSLTKFEFGQMLAERFALDSNNLKPVLMNESGLKATRGKDLSLSVERLEEALGESMPTMCECLDRFYSDWKRDIPRLIKCGLSDK